MHSPDLPARSIDAYGPFAPVQQMTALVERASHLDGRRILHVNSTATGGGVAELLRSIVPLSNDLGVDTTWLVMDADDAFFDVTKAMHNGLQGRGPALTEDMKRTYREGNARNAGDIADAYDLVIIHDPQPLGLLEHLEGAITDVPVIWRCHIDLTDPEEAYISFLEGFLDQIDHAIFSRDAYRQHLDMPVASVVHPAIDPIAPKNRSLNVKTMTSERDHLDPIDHGAPLLTQISRFDPWKGQFTSIETFKRARTAIPDLQLALVGGMAGDDPEGLALYERVAKAAVDDQAIHVLTDLPDERVNYLQRTADVVLQFSLREGFGLVVSEALWKRTPVVGSAVGGIPLQVIDRENGYLVDPHDVETATDRVVSLLENDDQRRAFGEHGRSHVQERFLLPRQLAESFAVYTAVLADQP